MLKKYLGCIKTVYNDKIRKHIKPVTKYSVVNLLLLALLVNFIVECFSRSSVIKAVVFAFTKPHIFLYGVLIIAMTMSFGLVIRRRYFWYLLVSSLWLAGGITNYVILSARVTPFTFTDIVLLGDALAVWHLYYSKAKMFMMVTGVVLAIIAIIVCWFLLPKYKGKLNRLTGAITAAVFMILVYGVTSLYLNFGVVKSSFANIANAYKNYGFTYCFSGSVINRGVRKPKGYSSEIIQQIKDGIVANDDNNKQEEKDYPNIIFVQLESFFNPNNLKGTTFTENPVPYFEYLYENYPHGYLSVPSFGAGTANTEVEVIIGMNIDDFGTGEYPYKTIFNKQVCESAAFDLRELGYTAHAIHNNTAGFYSRHQVFANLGFNTFTSVEFMTKFDTTPLGWAKDGCLIQAITDCMDYSDGVDYIYTISVQGHGSYPNDYTEEDYVANNMNIRVSDFADEENTGSFTYYVNQISEMDQFVRNLVTELDKRDEKTMVVFYGDHLPTFDLDDDDLKEASVYETQYVVWNNFDLPMVEKNLQAYQLTAHVLDMVGVSQGTLIEYHQTYSESEDYLKNLKQLEYDMLYGGHYVYDGEVPFEKTDIKYGVRDIVVKGVTVTNDETWVFGDNFTKYSKVLINNKEYETEYVSDFLIKVKDYNLVEGDVVKILQRNGTISFYETNEVVY